MPVFLLGDELAFPPPESASAEGVVAVGGNITPQRLLLAYGQGIFPWPVERLPLLWFSPDPRFVLFPQEVRVPRSLRRSIRRGTYRVVADQAFDQVITACAEVPRPGQDGTWITDELLDGYVALHELGYAHSIEAWDADSGRLVGGLYGVSLGRAFFGESMFARAPDASKVAFVTLVGNLAARGFHFIDCQVETDHLARFGARNVPRDAFLAGLRAAVAAAPTAVGPWTLDLDPTAALATLSRQG
ncbi:MAG TPA: leucyl/phenylalanyl-tRNA--protein transferase [Polyangiaceae bacterium LLY-WYZ-14_1]|nr:leucyl/phenylalanyl-tRNA--protein transferase [Polyangiaceae bacterium LLY-WYZ-14_1]